MGYEQTRKHNYEEWEKTRRHTKAGAQPGQDILIGTSRTTEASCCFVLRDKFLNRYFDMSDLKQKKIINWEKDSQRINSIATVDPPSVRAEVVMVLLGDASDASNLTVM